MTKEDHRDKTHNGSRKGQGDHSTDDSSTESKGKRDQGHRKDRDHKEEIKGRRKRERGRSSKDDGEGESDDDSSHHERLSRHHRDTRKKRRRRDDDSEDSSYDQNHRRKSSHRKKETDQRKRKDKKSHSKPEKKDKKNKKPKKDRHKVRGDKDELKHDDQRSEAATARTRQQHDKKALYPMGEPLGRPPATLINPEMDYFTYHQEFWVYLFREEGVRFNDLNSEDAREAFQRFSAQYNDGKLERPYYDNPPTFPSEVLDECKTTDHKWGFQTTEAERRGLEQLQEGVRRLTQYQDQKE